MSAWYRFHMYPESLSLYHCYHTDSPHYSSWSMDLLNPAQITCRGIYLQSSIFGVFFLPVDTLLSANNVPSSGCFLFFDCEGHSSQHFLTLYQLISAVIPHSESRKPSVLLKAVSSFRKILCSWWTTANTHMHSLSAFKSIEDDCKIEISLSCLIWGQYNFRISILNFKTTDESFWWTKETIVKMLLSFVTLCFSSCSSIL